MPAPTAFRVCDRDNYCFDTFMVAYSRLMEKRRPTYNLDAIKAAIGFPETLAITRSAFADALSMGFSRAGIADVIQEILSPMFLSR